jgi:hypothetical protein
VAGSYEKQIDKIEAKLTPVEAGQGQATDWTTIKTLPLNGNFSVVMDVRQGWYILEVRGSLNGQTIGDVTRIDRVGVGEVFIIAGQSNAEGVSAIQGTGAVSDRVNCFATANDPASGGDGYISLSPFSKLNSDSRIAPRGVNGWCWGKLGDLLVEKLNVPVLFFNVALNGTNIQAWANTAKGGYAVNPYVGGVYANKLPYKNLSEVLHYFTVQLGIRSILWCQGEADNYLGNQKVVTDATVYKNNLKTVINQTRVETGKNISWVVSLTSAAIPCTNCVSAPFAPSDENVLQGQRATIAEVTNVFKGPETDGIENPGRQEGAHINAQLPRLAAAWSDALNDNFFINSTPQLPTVMGELAFKCNTNLMEVTLPDGYNTYEWSNNVLFNNAKFSNERKVNVEAVAGKQYYARYRDANDNVIQVPAISFVGSQVPVATINTVGNTSFCEGDKVVLQTNEASIYQWSNGSNTKEITVSNSGNYSVKLINQFGCQSDASSVVATTLKLLPPKPTILANAPMIFCADTNVTLLASNQNAATFLWNDGSKTRSLKINTTGNFKVRTISNEGCTSVESDEVKVIVNSLPARPSIVPDGPTTFCADTSVVLTSTNQDALAYRWSSGSFSRSISVKNTGDFAVRTVDKNGCISPISITTKIKVNNLPVAPSIVSTKDTVFCQGDNTILQMSLANGNYPTWIGYQDNVVSKYAFQNLNVNKSGAFQAFQTDNNNCKSPITAPLYVSVKALPAKVESIVRLSPYTVGVASPQASQFIWYFNGVENKSFTGTSLRFSEATSFKVAAKNVYKTTFYGDKVCLSEPSSDFYFELYNDAGLSIYPNPSKGVFNIDAKVNWRDVAIEIFTLSGEYVTTGYVSGLDDIKSVDLTKIPEGEYFLRVKSDIFTITKRIIIER